MTRWQKFTAALAGLAMLGGFALTAATPAAAQQRPSEEEMLNALKPAPRTRGLTVDTRDNGADQRFIDSIRGKTRQLTLGERQKVADIAKDKPKIDLEIYFDYNSATITSQAEPDLMKLGRVLTSSDLKGSVFMIGGHTDAKGGEDYNQRLSERRAASVKRFLKDRFDIADDTLVTTGYGKEQLKRADDPYAPENRRVQIVNLEQRPTANR